MDNWLTKKGRETTYEGCQIYPSKPHTETPKEQCHVVSKATNQATSRMGALAVELSNVEMQTI